MQGYRLRANYMWIVGMLMVLFPNISTASDGQVVARGEGQSEVAVVSLVFGAKQSTSEKSFKEHVARWLDGENVKFIDSSSLQSRLAARQVAPSDPEVEAKFKDIEAVVTQGTEDFYYKGNDAALEVLKPVFDRGLSHMEVTARSPEYTEQVFQAGLMLIRAYTGAGDPLLASEIAGKLAGYFPGKEPSLSLVPPDVVALWRTEVEKIAAMGTSIRLEYIANRACEAHINGVPVTTQPVIVQAELNYMVMLHCGKTSSSLWRVRVKAGEKAQMPLIGGDLVVVSSDAMDEATKRREAEFRLKAVSYWTGIETVLGLYEDGAGESLVRFDGKVDAPARVSWIAREPGAMDAAVDAMMLEAFPAVSLARAEKAEADRLRADATPWTTDWMTPTVFVAGAGAVALGGVFLFDASSQATVMNCSPNAAITPVEGQCKGVKKVNFSNSEEYYNEWDKVHRDRIIGYSGLGVGAALVGWGAWRLLSGGDSSEPASGADVGVWGGRGSLGATARWKF